MSLCQQVKLSQVSLYPLDVLNKQGIVSTASARDHDRPSMCLVRQYCDGRVRFGDRIVFSEALDEQKDQLIRGYAFSSHEAFIADDSGRANLRNAA